MNPVAGSSTAAEINRLHHEAQRCATVSRENLQAALAAAWQAGQLLLTEGQTVYRRMGRGDWLFWLERYFQGTPRTAQRYMKLAATVADMTILQGMSLRQTYSRLGIATEPKTPAKCPLAHALPVHVVLSNRLVRALKRHAQGANAEQEDSYRRDLRLLYEQLRPWFETGANTSANFTSAASLPKS